ncbi:MAG: RtcB family protein [Acidobacteria bacterium]|nr:RtcB family protein [Acidobacteriota bacterium]
MTERFHDVIDVPGGVPIRAWTRGVAFEPEARRQLVNIAQLPFIHKWVAAMPDVHLGKGATVGSVVPTNGAIIPAAVGVDIGCGMMAVRTSLTASDLPDSLKELRAAIEKAVPHGRTEDGRRHDKGAWKTPPENVAKEWAALAVRFDEIAKKHPAVSRANHETHLGTLGTGNHFIEVCLDESGSVWFVLHSGSRGVGNRIGTYFINVAREEMRRHFINLPDLDLAYLPEGTKHFDDYVEAVGWAQDYARTNRHLMMENLLAAVRQVPGLPAFAADLTVVNCHHNYVEREHHYGKNVWLTRKGAVRARAGELGIIPGSMGARTYIVSGKGNPESFHSCSHGAGRSMSRTEAKRRFTVGDHEKATLGIECRKDAGVIDETPMAYKSIDAVMEAQKDLVEILHTLRQVVCVKG